MSLTNQQKAEMALVHASDAVPTDSNAVREMRIARAALHMAASMMDSILIEETRWSGEFSVIEYFTTEVRKALEAKEAKAKLEDERAYLLKVHGFAWDVLRECYFVKATSERVHTPVIQAHLEKRTRDMAAAGPAPDTILLPGALATGEYIRLNVTDQLGRMVPVIQSELEMRPSQTLRYPERHFNFAIKVSTYSDDPVTRAAEQALVKWLKTLKHNDPRRTYVEQSLSNLSCGIFLLYSHEMSEHIAIGVKEMNVDKTTMPIRVLGMHYNSDAHYSVIDALQITMGESVSINWITENK